MFAQLLLVPPGTGKLWSCGKRQVPQQIPSQPTAPLLWLPARSALARQAPMAEQDVMGAEHLQCGVVLLGNVPDAAGTGQQLWPLF